MDQSDTTSLKASAAAETNGRLPQSGWLSDIVVIELLSICSLSSEAVVAEAMAHVEVSKSDSKPVSVVTPSLRKRPGAALKRTDLLVFQSLAIHAISCLYELVLRRNAMDRRFQKESCRGRIAGLVASPILDKSLSSSRWLARMESTHKVRSIWLLCFVFILQEAPEAMLREYLRVLGAPKVRGSVSPCALSNCIWLTYSPGPSHTSFRSLAENVHFDISELCALASARIVRVRLRHELVALAATGEFQYGLCCNQCSCRGMCRSTGVSSRGTREASRCNPGSSFAASFDASIFCHSSSRDWGRTSDLRKNGSGAVPYNDWNQYSALAESHAWIDE